MANNSAETSAAGVTVDAVGDVYLTGFTDSADFPVTPFAYQPIYGGGDKDVFVAKFPLGAPGAISITGIQPNVGGNTGTVSPQIAGTGFHAGGTAQLNCGGQSVAGANLMVGAGGRLINTTFDLTSALPGGCIIVVTNPDGTFATLAEAFAVKQGGAPNIQLYLTGVIRVPPSEETGASASAAYFLTATNSGSVDAPNTLIASTLGQNPSLTSVQPPGLTDLPTMQAQGIATWVVPNLAPGQSMVFSYGGTISPSSALSPIGSAFAILDEVPPFPLPLPLPPLPVPPPPLPPIPLTPPVTEKKFLGCTRAEWGGCGAAAFACGQAIDVCTSPGYTNKRTCDLAIGACVSAALLCPALKPCLPALLAGLATLVFEMDPNGIAGPIGVGGQRWIAGTQALTYGVSFGNESNATAPAQKVVVTQPLSTNVDLSTLSLPGIMIPNGASNVQVNIPQGAFSPAVGMNEFATNVDLRPTQSLLVAVDAKLNPATQTLTWTLTSIDPTTGLPPLNPLVGFLPPGAGASVSFSVTPKQGIAPGSQVAEQAMVVFDANAPLNTPVWVNTVDNTPPVSHVSALPATSSCPAFRVGWSGSDLGSGLQGFTVYVSDTGSPFVRWLSNTTAAAADYTGTVGHTYSFYSVATDLTGNIEAAKTSAEATTIVTAAGPCGAPSLNGQVTNVSQSGTTVTVTLQLTNTGFTAAQAVNVNQMSVRTLSGSGIVTLASPTFPAAEGALAIGASTTVTLNFNVPTTVTRFSMTEGGNLLDGSGSSYRYSIAQTVIP
jgi:hypothetical protein